MPATANDNNRPEWLEIVDDIRAVATGTKAPTVNTEVGVEDDSIYKIAAALALVAFLAALFWGIARHLSNK